MSEKQVSDTQKNIDELMKEARNKVSWRERRDAVTELSNHDYRQSVDILKHILYKDRVFNVQYAALQSLQKLGVKDIRLPKKKDPYSKKEIVKVFRLIKSHIKEDITVEAIKEKMKQVNPEMYDVMSHEKKDKFDSWLENTMRTLPKK